MEEKKNFKMGVVKGGKSLSAEKSVSDGDGQGEMAGQKQQRLTYEQLNDACQQLFQQNQQLLKQLKEQNMINMFKRLDYLFKVVELDGATHYDSDVRFDHDFVKSCIGEIQDAMTIKDEHDGKEEAKE